MIYDIELRWSARGRIAEMECIRSPVHLPRDFCFLVCRTDGRPAQPAFDYLASSYLGGSRVRVLTVAKNTVKAVADDLADFHHFLDAKDLCVRDVNEQDLEEYLRSMTTLASPVTRKPYAKSTVHRRRATVTRFLKFCQERGYLRHRFKVENISTPKGLVQRFAPNLPGPKQDPIDKLVRAIDPNVLRPLLEELGSEIIDVTSPDLNSSARPATARLMAELCLHTGLRRSEACSLGWKSIESTSTDGRDALTSIAIEIEGKGSKRRKVPIPVWLVRAMSSYSRNVRAPAVNQAVQERALAEAHPYLFVIDRGRRGVKGRPITPKQFNHYFAQARERMLSALRDTDPKLYQLSKGSHITVHALRHTFALMTYISRRDHGDTCPSKYVQAVLGHSFQDTTERIYLRSSHVYESELSQALELLVDTPDNQLSRQKG